MKVYIAVGIEYDYEDSSLSATICRTFKDAEMEGDFVFPVNLDELGEVKLSEQLQIQCPDLFRIRREPYMKWYKANGAWANKVAEKLNMGGFLTPADYFTRRRQR